MPDLRDDQGATMAEYALMVAFVAMAAFLAVTMFGGALRDLFQNAADLMAGTPSPVSPEQLETLHLKLDL